MKIYYTYHIVDPQTNKPFYIGKGKGPRAYIHMIRALNWRNTGNKVLGANLHLYNKLLKLHDNGLEPTYIFVLENVLEADALAREMEDIKSIGLENLCNLTYGGEGEIRSLESLKKLSESLQKFWASESGIQLKQKFSETRMGEDNPMWGNIETDEHKKQRMVNCLSKTRWNTGLKGDPRSKGHHVGEPAHNALKCRLVNDDGRIVEAASIKELSILSGVPLTTINRLHLGICKTNKKGWRFELIDKIQLPTKDTDEGV